MLTGKVLLQLIMILLVVQLFGNLSKRIGQQWVITTMMAWPLLPLLGYRSVDVEAAREEALEQLVS